MALNGKRYAEVQALRIAYHDIGMGEPVVFLHGFSGPDSWSGVVEHLCGRFRCVVIETLGLGDAQGPLAADYSLPGQAALVKGVLDSLGLQAVHLVGHDTGGAIAQIFAVRWPESVHRLVLADCDAFDNWPPGQVKLLQRVAGLPGGVRLMAAALRVPALARCPLGFGRLVFDKQLLTANRLASYARPLTSGSVSRERFRRFLLAMDSRYTLEIVESLRRFTRPTMIVWGCEDSYWTPSWAKRLYDTIPGAERLELIPFAGLACHEERPDCFAELLGQFLGANTSRS